MPSAAWKQLGDYLHETQLLGSIQNTLYWDQNTSMPSAGSGWRGEQLSLLARYLHSRQSSNHFESILAQAKSEFYEITKSGECCKEDQIQRSRNIELLEQDLKRQKSLDPDLVASIAMAKAEGYNLWQEAKKKSDFAIFSPALINLISLKKEEANQLSERRSCWETLAQPFEPDLTITRLKELFEPLRKVLPELLDKVRSWDRRIVLDWDLEEKAQEELCDLLLDQWSRDQRNTVIARSPHPFSITLGPKDFRITTRVVLGQPLSGFLATAHEWGHSLYEQGLPSRSHEWFAWPLGKATSMGVHESQSLFWENRVARSSAFSERFWPNFARYGAPIKCSGDLWRAMNPMSPGLNRVEADELTYGLHILIRTDLEIALLEGGLDVADLPAEWNKSYTDLLGVTPNNDSEGCLQDVHWSEGAFGYFPSYLLGHLISAQLAEAMANRLKTDGLNSGDPIGTCIRSGNESTLIAWLRKEVHCYGRQMNAEELVKKVTGKELSSEIFLNYLRNKLEHLTSSN